MAHTVYENFILANKIKDMIDTKLNMNQFATVDSSLTEAEGMTKKIHIYNTNGSVRDVAQGEGNVTGDDVEVSFTEKEYTVKFTQGRFPYFDEQAMTDGMLVDTGMQKMSANMTNDMNNKVFGELQKGTNRVDYSTLDYDAFVDAIAEYEGKHEDTTGLFAIMSYADEAKLKKALKDQLKYVEAFARTGYIGSINGCPIYKSKSARENEILIATKEAVTIFTKKEVIAEQERDVNTRKNTIFARRCNVVALTDNSEIIKLVKAIPELTVTLTGRKLQAQTAVASHTFAYAVDVEKPILGEVVTGYTTYTAETSAFTSGKKVSVVQLDSEGKVVKYGEAIA